MEFRFPYSSLPFDEFIRYLNGGHYLDTFEVGSVKIPEIIWPTVSRTTYKRNEAVEKILNRPWIDPSKFEDDDKLCQTHKKKEVGSLGKKTQQLGLIKNPESVEKKQVGFKNQLGHENPTSTMIENNNQRPPHKTTLKKAPETNQVSKIRKFIEEATKGKKKASACPKKLPSNDDDDDEVNEVEIRRILKEMTGSGLPSMLDDLDESCLIHEEKKKKASSVSSGLDHRKGLKRKMNDTESEKKRKRVECEKPSRAKKAPVQKRVMSKLQSQSRVHRMKLDPAMFL